MKFFSILLSMIGFGTSCAADNVITPEQFQEAVKTDTAAVVLDVRTAEEYAAGHLENATLLDFKQPETFKQGIQNLDKSKTYYVYCRSGRRSHNASVEMQAIGLKVWDMQGGYLNWTAKGLPVVK